MIRACPNDFWDLDNGIDKYIDLINSNNDIRTMYSFKGNNKFGFGQMSYLIFCYTKSFEKQVLNVIIPKMKNEFGSMEYAELNVYIEKPKLQKKEKDVAPYLRFINHPDYWNINHIKIELMDGNSYEHENLWKVLTKSLTT
ncbi:hypothetical protein [Polaribacter sp. SA4-12]|uniref:hypothetical protein n=1 Tax=Polaribacter sp. SA4-12 TaxID=1312072 RepID=UPI0012F76D99|nr:hypothetical protein [Polaribacter sp. SA4-12]